jgi:hypothetical protein
MDLWPTHTHENQFLLLAPIPGPRPPRILAPFIIFDCAIRNWAYHRHEFQDLTHAPGSATSLSFNLQPQGSSHAPKACPLTRSSVRT